MILFTSLYSLVSRSLTAHCSRLEPERPLPHNIKKQQIPPFDNNVIILEVKYNHALPTYIRDLLGEYCQGALQSAISKYTWCRRFEGMGEE